MKFLIDTNIFIPLEPTEYDDLENNTILATDFDRLSAKAQQQLFLHPAQIIDISKDSDERRRHIREIQFKKYPILSNPPNISEELEKIIGKATHGTNDWVDNQLLASLKSDAVDYLVTRICKSGKKLKR